MKEYPQYKKVLFCTDFSENSDYAFDFAYGIAIDSQNRIATVGVSTALGKETFAFARLLENGLLDTSFGPDGTGKVLFDFGPTATNQEAYALTLDFQGRLIAAGVSNASGSSNDFAVVRLHSDGTVDTSFGSNGRVLINFGNNRSDVAQGISIDYNGRITIGGTSSGDFALAR